jgi:hypothetical protein
LKRAQNLDVISVPQEPLECHPKTEDRFMIRRLPEKVCESGFEIVPFVVETFEQATLVWAGKSGSKPLSQREVERGMSISHVLRFGLAVGFRVLPGGVLPNALEESVPQGSPVCQADVRHLL